MIGLGNPGIRYAKNRHNAGYMLVDEIANSKIANCQLLKTDTFMNDSGKFVKRIIRNSQFAVRNLYIAHDDLDLKLGTYKIQFGIGPKVHYGIKSIEDALNTKDFWRIRIGIDARDSGQARMTGEEYVLENFTDEELKILEGVYEKIKDDLAKL